MSAQGPNPSGLCMCGCGGAAPIAKQTHTRDGHVKGEPVCYIKSHHHRKSPVDYIVNPATGCWEWQLGMGKDGYGKTQVQGRTTGAHRVYYERHKGAIPDGWQIDHLCRNPPCVNPDHLEAVTASTNQRRGSQTKLTPGRVRWLRRRLGAGWTQRRVAEFIGCSQSLVSRVATAERWADVGETS